jgi:hypothetical protein
VANGKRRTANPPTPAEKRQLLRRHPAVWLATLSTVVGVATGMFTLRDQVFPREAGTAVAVSVPAYQQAIGRVCDDVNANDRARARSDTTIKRQLQRAKTAISQRNALLDGVRRTTSRSGHTLALLTALEPPPPLVSTRRGTEAAWNRNLARLRDYAMKLDRAGRHRQVAAAIDHLSTLRPALARDGDRVRSGLQRLGGANCDLEPPIVTRTYTLPPLHEAVNTPGTTTPPPTSNPSAGNDTNDPPPAAESANSGGDNGAVTTPPSTGGATTPPPTGGANTPPSSGGGGGGSGRGGANTPPTAGGGED